MAGEGNLTKHRWYVVYNCLQIKTWRDKYKRFNFQFSECRVNTYSKYSKVPHRDFFFLFCSSCSVWVWEIQGQTKVVCSKDCCWVYFTSSLLALANQSPDKVWPFTITLDFTIKKLLHLTGCYCTWLQHSKGKLNLHLKTVEGLNASKLKVENKLY